MYAIRDNENKIKGVSRWPSHPDDVEIDLSSDEWLMYVAERDAPDPKAVGFDYNGTMVPVTNEDAVGALQMEAGFERMGLQGTVFKLSNGEKLPLTAEDWPAFKQAFFTVRASFFAE